MRNIREITTNPPNTAPAATPPLLRLLPFDLGGFGGVVEEVRGVDEDEDVGAGGPLEDSAGSPVGDVVCSGDLEDPDGSEDDVAGTGSVEFGSGSLVLVGASVGSALGFDSGGGDCEGEGSPFVGCGSFVRVPGSFSVAGSRVGEGAGSGCWVMGSGGGLLGAGSLGGSGCCVGTDGGGSLFGGSFLDGSFFGRSGNR